MKRNCVLCLLLPSAYLALGCRVTSPDPAADGPSGSVPYQANLPSGWTGSSKADGQVFLHNAQKTVFALAAPFKAQSDESAEDALARVLPKLSALLPGAKILLHESVGEDQVLAKADFSDRGTPGQANLLCARRGSTGMLYAIAAPESIFAARRAMLVNVLRSFHYGSGSSTARSAPAGLGSISYRSWTDPKEGAFTLEVPAGWHVMGGAFRYAPIDIRRQVWVASPDGSILIQEGDARVTTFAGYGPSAQMRGLHEGQSYQVNGVTYTIAEHEDGAAFSKRYAEQFLKPKHPGMEIGDSSDRPDLAETVQAALHAASGLSAGETDFSYVKNGATIHGKSLALTVSSGQGLGAIWIAFPITIIAPQDQMDLAGRILKHMIEHSTDSPEWTQAQAETTKDFTAKVIRNHYATMAEMKRIYDRFTHQLAENGREWDNVITNSVDLKDAGGHTFHTDAGFTNYYSANGTVYGSNSGIAPPNVTALTQY